MLRLLTVGKWSKEEKRWGKVIDLQSARRIRLDPKRAQPKPRPKPAH